MLEKDVFRLVTSVYLAIEPFGPKVLGSIPHGDSEFFLCPTLVTRPTTSFSISLSSSKHTISLILIAKYCFKYLLMSILLSPC